MNECPKQWMLDLNDRYKAAAGIVITLSSASFVLPIFFLKDMVGIGSERTVLSELAWSAYLGWALLALSVASGILYHFFSAKWAKVAWNEKADVLWLFKDISAKAIERWLDWTYFFMTLGFAVGLFLVFWFMIHYQPTPKPETNEPKRLMAINIPPLPEFDPGSASISSRIENAICSVRQLVVDPASTVAIVIGRHDQTELTPRAKRQLSSNTELARHRTTAVEAALQDFRLCKSPPLANVIALDSTPRHVDSNATTLELAEDRRVEITLVRQAP